MMAPTNLRPPMQRRPELLIAAALFGANTFAQQARYEAPMPPVSRSGLHAIYLSAELLGASREDLADIRLLDSTGSQVPYVLRDVARAHGSERFVAYNLLRNEVMERRTEVEVEPPAGLDMDELHVLIKPIDAEKRVRITGSDDGDAWYMVKDEHVAPQGARGDPPHQVLILRIPRSDYRYLRLTLNDSLTAPMKVLGVGRYLPERAPDPMHAAPIDLPFARMDSASRTVLRITLPHALLVERLTIEAEDTVPFLRHITLGRWRGASANSSSQHGAHSRPEQLGSYTFFQGTGASFDTDPVRIDTFELLIDNGDDRPLRIRAIKAQCRQRVLLARLEAGMDYRLTTGDPRTGPARYDMAHFAAELPDPVDTLSPGPLRTIPAQNSAAPWFDPSAWWVWLAIASLTAGMALLAVRLLRAESK